MTGRDRHTCAATLEQIAQRLEAYAVFQDRPAAQAELEQIASEVRAAASALLAAGATGAAPP